VGGRGSSGYAAGPPGRGLSSVPCISWALGLRERVGLRKRTGDVGKFLA